MLSLGALAAAITAILSLVLPPDPEDSASIGAVRVVSQVPLSEYVQRVENAGPQKFGYNVATTKSRPPSATSTSRTQPTTRPITSSSTVTTSTRPPTLSGHDRFVATRDLDAKHFAETTDRICDRDQRLCQYVPRSVTATRVPLGAIVVGLSMDLDGKPVTPDVAAKRVLEVLKDARGNAEEEPVGAIVTVDLELAGLRGKPVELTWSMWQKAGGARLHGDWLNENLAYRLEATTNRDTTTVDLWVPLPKATGPYFIRVNLGTRGAPLASATSDPFD